MTSPMRPSSPTRTMSYMRAPRMPSATATGPVIFAIVPTIMSSPPQRDIEADRSPDEPRQVGAMVLAYLELLPDRQGDHDRPVDRIDLLLDAFVDCAHQLLVDGD